MKYEIQNKTVIAVKVLYPSVSPMTAITDMQNDGLEISYISEQDYGCVAYLDLGSRYEYFDDMDDEDIASLDKCIKEEAASFVENISEYFKPMS